MGSRESLKSRLSRSTESISTIQGATATQRPRDPCRSREPTPVEKPKIIEGRNINLVIYIPEKYHSVQLKEQK